MNGCNQSDDESNDQEETVFHERKKNVYEMYIYIFCVCDIFVLQSSTFVFTVVAAND